MLNQILYFCYMANILVIEDEKRVAELLQRGLQELEHRVTLASNVVDALDRKSVV